MWSRSRLSWSAPCGAGRCFYEGGERCVRRGTVGGVNPARARRFWDARAREDAYFFVDNRRAYRVSDLVSFWAQGERDLDRLLGALDLRINAGDMVVDIGCGVGRLTRPIAARARRVYALDISSEMLERARSHLADFENIEWILGDGSSLRPLREASVDACVSHVVFQHIPDPEVTLAYVAEMARVLRPGGWAAFQVSNDPRVHRRSGLRSAPARAVSAALGRAPRGQGHPAWRGSAVDLDALRHHAERSGLALDRIVGEGEQLCLIGARRKDVQLRESLRSLDG
jgi:SAM-dependent methyltransferase